jgi:hypothetical protein
MLFHGANAAATTTAELHVTFDEATESDTSYGNEDAAVAFQANEALVVAQRP